MKINGQIANFAEFKAFYENELKQNGIVGSSFVFLKDNKILMKDFVGSANLEKNQAVNENTILSLGVEHKTFYGNCNYAIA